MRRARITYQTAWHHVTNRGHNKSNIFINPEDRIFFLKLMKKYSLKHKIQLVCYCLMGNHFHLLIQNTSGKMSQYMKDLNGLYGAYFRKRYGGTGYVFQGRFHSTIIEKGEYFIQAFLYILWNPVRSCLCPDPFTYKWSSINEYFDNKKRLTRFGIIENIFKTKNNLVQEISAFKEQGLFIPKVRVGSYIGSFKFIREAERRFNRREKNIVFGRRFQDHSFEKPYEVIKNFEELYKIKILQFDFHNRIEQHWRARLLVELKDRTGLTYKAVSSIPPFNQLSLSGLPKIYRTMKNKVIK